MSGAGACGEVRSFMGFLAFGQTGRVVRGVAVAAALGVGFVAVTPALVRAAADESLFMQMKRKKAEADGVPTQLSGHTQGSGIKATTQTGVVAGENVTPFI